MSTINYLTVRNTIMPVVRAVTGNYSTLTGSTITGSAIATSTIATSAITVSTLNLASTMISLGQSTNQTYNNFSNGSYLTWATPKSDMTSANKTVQSANGLYQMIVANATSGLFLSSDSGITWSTLTGGLPTLTGSAYWSDGAISANGQYITLSIYGGSLWMSADYGRTFALTNQPTPSIWLPLNGNTTDSMGSSTVTATGSPGYVTLNYPGYTAQAVNLANTAGGTATRYIRGTWTASDNFMISLWFNTQSTGVQQIIFDSGNEIAIYINGSQQLCYQCVSNGVPITSVVTTANAIVINTWYYVTVIFQKNGLCSMYLNNTLVGSSTNIGGYAPYPSVNQFSLGTYDDSTNLAFNGYVDDLRITNSVSTYVPIPLLQPNIWMPFENTAGDLGSYSLPPSATPAIYLPFEGNVTDSVGSSAPVATGAVTYPQANREGYTGQAIRLTNTAGGTATQYVRGNWSAVTSQTISFWFNMQTGSAAQFLCTAYYNGIVIGINTDNTVYLRLPVNSGYSTTFIVSSAISTSTWYYVTAIVNIGGTCSFYLNNTLVGTYENTGFGDYGSSGSFGLGTTEQGTASNAFNGLIDDFRMYNSAIPYVPVSNTTVTGSLSYVPGVVGLNAVNLVNTAGGTATNFIRGACSPMGSDITVSGWFNVQSFSTNGYQVIFEMYGNSIELYVDDANRRVIGRVASGSGLSILEMAAPISLNTWYHTCIIFRVNGACSFHLNGTLIQTVTNSGGYGTRTSTSLFSLGTYATTSPINAFNGYVDDFRIYNAAIPYHVLFPQNYRSLALSGTGQYALASAASGWVVGSSDSSRTWEKEAVCVGTQSEFIQPQLTGLAATATTWTQNGVTWTAAESSNNGSTQSVSRAFNNNTTTDAWLSNNVTQRYTAGSPNGNAASTNIQTIGATAGEWIQIQTSVPMVLASFAFGIGLNAYPSTGTPKTYYIVGSTDGTTWVPLQFGNFTISAWTFASSNITMNITGTQTLTGNMVGSVTTMAYPSYTNNAYTRFRLIGTSLMVYGGSAGTTYMEVGEWYLNFVRPFSLYSPPTHALSMNHTGQYQMVATGPAAGSIMPNQTGLVTNTWSQGGVNWGVSASSTATGLPAYSIFDNSIATYWAGANNVFSSSGNTSSFSNTFYLNGTSILTIPGEWVQITSSVPVVLSSYQIGVSNPNNTAKTYFIVGSNDGSTWYAIQYASAAAAPAASNFVLIANSIIVNSNSTQTWGLSTLTTTTYTGTTNAYTYFRFIITSVFFATVTIPQFGELYLNFSNSVSYSANYGTTWLNTSRTVSNESVALSSSGQYSLSTNSVVPFARLRLDGNNVDAQGVLAPTTGAGTVTYDTSIKAVGTHSALFANTAGGSPPTMYLRYTTPSLIHTPSALTISLWIYPTALPTSALSIPFSFFNPTGYAASNQFYINPAGALRFNWYTTAPNGGDIGTTNAILNTWSHLAVTFNAGTFIFYVNGVVSATLVSSGNMCVYGPVSMTNIFVGSNSPDYNAYAGYVDDVRIYTSALSATAISTLYNNPTITQSQIVAVSNSYLPITAYTFPALTGIGTANIVDTAVSQTGQYMVAVTSSTTNNVYYSTDYGATFTALTVGSSAMVSCSISYDGSYLTVESATTVHTLNRNTRGFSVTVGNQAGLINQAQNAIAIGDKAGRTNQSANSIVLNATGNALDAVAPGFYVAPVATAASSSAAPFSLLGYGTDNQIVQSSALTVLQNGNIVANGNVGIGTALPGAKLSVIPVDGLQNHDLLSFVNTNGYGIYVNTSSISSRGNTLDWYSRDFNFASITTRPILTMRPEGNVGIGTTAPVFPLTLQTSTGSFGFVHTDGTISVGSYVGGSVIGGWYGTASNHPLCFYTNNSAAQMVLLPGGNVGIGVTAPVGSLHINGITGSGLWGNACLVITNSISGAAGTTSGTSIQLHNAFNSTYFNMMSYGYTGGSAVYITSDSLVGVTFSRGQNAWSTYSDSRMKINKVPLSSELSNILKLNPVSYLYDTDPSDNVNIVSRVGFLADEVFDIYPNLVTKDSGMPHTNQDGETFIPMTMCMTNLIPYHTKAIQELAYKNDALEATNTELTQKLDALSASHAALQAANAATSSQMAALIAWAQTQGFTL